MAQNFNEMTKEELEAVLNGDSIALLNTVELNSLRKAAKAAGILTVQYDNMLGIAINNRTYEEIKNSDKYTEEEKALALEARNEYNKELRVNTKNKLYNAEEIMSRAVEVNGQYHFDDLTKGEMDFLLSNGIVRLNELSIGKQYSIGQEPNRDFTKDVAKTSKNLSEDVKKSAEFWGNFKDKKTGLSCIIQALKDNSVKVEAKKGTETVAKIIDHGKQGVNLVEPDKGEKNTVEPYEIYDLIIKKAKVANPKAKIRIKDSVKDPIVRNKILLACAKNNMEPIGNLPEGFNFAILKEIVKDVKDAATINALAEHLDDLSYETMENAAQQSNAAVVQKDKEDDKPTAGIIPVVVNGGNGSNNTETENGDNGSNNAGAGNGGNGGNGSNNASAGNGGNNGASAPIQPPAVIPTPQNTTPTKPVEAPKRPWWKKVRDAVVVGGIAFLGFLGVKNCQGNQKLEKNIKDLQEQVDKKSMEDCDALTNIRNDAYFKGLMDGKKECEDQNKPKPKPQTKPVNRKKTPTPKPVKEDKKSDERNIIINVKEVNVLPSGVAENQKDTVYVPVEKVDTVYVPVEKEEVPVAQPRQEKPKSTVPLEAVNTGIQHEKDYDLNEAVELTSSGKVTETNAKKKKTLDLSNPADFNAVYNSINTKVH